MDGDQEGGLFRIYSNIYDEAFLRKIAAKSNYLFSQKSSIVDFLQGSKYPLKVIGNIIVQSFQFLDKCIGQFGKMYFQKHLFSKHFVEDLLKVVLICRFSLKFHELMKQIVLNIKNF